MKDWREEYQGKLISAEEAAQLIKSGYRIAFTSGREALATGLAIAARKEELNNVCVYAPTPTYDFGWYDPGWEDSFNITIRMPTGLCQEAVDAKRVDFDPGNLIPFLELPKDIDILLTEVSSPDKKGFCGFGASLWAKKRQVREAKLTIAEVNKNLIRTYGDNFIHISEIDYFVEHIGSAHVPGMGSLAGTPLREPEPYLKDIGVKQKQKGLVNLVVEVQFMKV